MKTFHSFPIALALTLLISLALAACEDAGGNGSQDPSESADSPTPKSALAAMEVDAKEGSSSGASSSAAALKAELREVAGDGEAPAPDATDPKGLDFMYVGQFVTGTLNSVDSQLNGGNYFDEWVLDISRSGVIQIDMESFSVDSYVSLARGWSGGPLTILAEDDDGGTGLHSSMTVRVEPGIHSIFATSYVGYEVGRYWLHASWR